MTTNCNKCGCPVNWDKLIDKTYKKKDGSQGHGWWREDLSKEHHTNERCENFSKSGEWKKTLDFDNADQAVKHLMDKAKPFEYIILGKDQQELAQLLTREEIELKHLVESVIQKEHPEYNNPASIGQIYARIGDRLQKLKEKKENDS